MGRNGIIENEDGMKHYQGIIFDLDGTLLDTLEDLGDAVNFALSKNGFPKRTYEEVRSFVGNGVKNLILRALSGNELIVEPESKVFTTVFSDFKAYYAENSRKKTRPYSGIFNLLQDLKADGRKIAVVSNKYNQAAQELTDLYFPGLIDVTIGETEGLRRKPAPDTVFRALEILDCSVSDAVYIGDSEVDIETAFQAEMPCISVAWGFRSAEQLKKAGAKQIFSQPAELYALLK